MWIVDYVDRGFCGLRILQWTGFCGLWIVDSGGLWIVESDHGGSRIAGFRDYVDSVDCGFWMEDFVD